MAYNKFITSSGRVFLDLTNDTITPEDLREGVTAHDRGGNLITGTLEEYDGSVRDEIPASLMSSDGSVLTDVNGIIITTKEE